MPRKPANFSDLASPEPGSMPLLIKTSLRTKKHGRARYHKGADETKGVVGFYDNNLADDWYHHGGNAPDNGDADALIGEHGRQAGPGERHWPQRRPRQRSRLLVPAIE